MCGQQGSEGTSSERSAAAVARSRGAACIAFSGILVRLADVSPSTAAFYRCAYAVPPLLAIAAFERRRLGPRGTRARSLAWLAGVFFAGERPRARRPLRRAHRGAYAGFLLALRASSADIRRSGGALFHATLASALVVLPAGWLLGELELRTSWESFAWLVTLALTSQVLGWLLSLRDRPRDGAQAFRSNLT